MSKVIIERIQGQRDLNSTEELNLNAISIPNLVEFEAAFTNIYQLALLRISTDMLSQLNTFSREAYLAQSIGL